jgi:hypothetical protein
MDDHSVAHEHSDDPGDLAVDVAPEPTGAPMHGSRSVHRVHQRAAVDLLVMREIGPHDDTGLAKDGKTGLHYMFDQDTEVEGAEALSEGQHVLAHVTGGHYVVRAVVKSRR